MVGTRLWICRGANSSRGCWPTTRCSHATKSIFDVCYRLVAILAVGVSIASCDSARGRDSEETLRTGLTFDRREVADHSGDVKLVGDIDGDGRLDLVLGGLPRTPLSWWRWPDLLLTTIASARVEFTTDGVLVDVDGDDDLDIVTADGPDGANLVWFANPRPDRDPTDGPSWKRHEIGALGGWGKDIKAADFDGDGLADIVVRAPSELMIFFHDGAGAWTRVALPSLHLGEEGMALGDINGDGAVDLVLHGQWAQNPGTTARNPARWQSHVVGAFNPAFKALVVDLDQDGNADILTSSSEHTADVAWFQAVDGPAGRWIRHIIQPAVAGAHTLQAADMDGDGDVDVVVGQMHTTEERALSIHLNMDGRGMRWARHVTDTVGLHNGVVADVDNDGDFDIYGANWAGNPPAWIWINRLDPPESVRRLDRWSHHQITHAHVRSFGLAFADMDGDGRTDIISGPFWYRQPADPWLGEWEQIRLGEGVDAIAAIDVDGDGRAEVIAQRGGGETLNLVWLQAQQAPTRGLGEHAIGEVPAASHEIGAQGQALAQIVEGGQPELAVSSGAGVFYFAIPDDPAAGPWPRTRICAEASDEGIAFADIDGDGLLDLAATTGNAKGIAWWRNPGDGSADWQRRDVADVPNMVYPDRVAVADLDGDGRTDIVVSEENGQADHAKAYWWRNPGDIRPNWEQQEITSRGSLNSLSVADMNDDGRPDLVMGEHRGALRLSLWRNLGGGRFIEQLVGEGVESHLGARTVDLDGDGDHEIVSIGWDAPKAIHVLRNDATRSIGPRGRAGTPR